MTSSKELSPHDRGDRFSIYRRIRRLRADRHAIFEAAQLVPSLLVLPDQRRAMMKKCSNRQLREALAIGDEVSRNAALKKLRRKGVVPVQPEPGFFPPPPCEEGCCCRTKEEFWDVAADKLNHCGVRCSHHECASCGHVQGGWNVHRECGFALCPWWQLRSSNRKFYRARLALEELRDDVRPLFVTLTIRHSLEDRLKDSIKHFKSSWMRLKRTKFWKDRVACGLWAMETPWNPATGWHCHFHLAVEPQAMRDDDGNELLDDQGKTRFWEVTNEDVSAAWRAATTRTKARDGFDVEGSYIIRVQKTREGFEREVAKYCVCPADISWKKTRHPKSGKHIFVRDERGRRVRADKTMTARLMLEFVEATYGVQTFHAFGKRGAKDGRGLHGKVEALYEAWRAEQDELAETAATPCLSEECFSVEPLLRVEEVLLRDFLEALRVQEGLEPNTPDEARGPPSHGLGLGYAEPARSQLAVPAS